MAEFAPYPLGRGLALSNLFNERAAAHGLNHPRIDPDKARALGPLDHLAVRRVLRAKSGPHGIMIEERPVFRSKDCVLPAQTKHALQ
jgi:hypothetical protein